MFKTEIRVFFNMLTRSGTNEIHGTVWEFLRNHKLNARNFFAPSDKPKLIQNQFGAAAGGPLRKDHLFLFGSYEGLRVRPAALSTSAFPPTAAERAGDFSSSRTPVRDPSTGQPFPGNRVPAERFDPVVRNIFARELLPLPNRPDGQLVTTSAQPQNNNTFLARVDYNLRRHTIDARYHYNLASEAAYNGNIPTWMPVTRRAKSQNITLGDTVGLKPNLLNQARLSFNRVFGATESLVRLHLSDLGGNLPMYGPRQPPAITVSGRFTLGSASGGDAIQVNESFQFSDHVNWSRGPHTVKAGFELLKLRYLNRGSFRTMGEFTFDGAVTGNAVADFVLGKPAQMVIASPLLEQAGLQTNTFYFLQDDWRVHPRLTLNLGLRYELALPWVHPQDLWGTIRFGQQSQKIKTAPLGMVFPDDPGVPRGLVQTDKNNLAPRFGFAWDLFGNGRTSLRGAYGIFYESINADIIQNTSQPFSYTFTIPTPFSLSDPLRGHPPIPMYLNLVDPPFVGVQQLFFPDPCLRSPYMQHFNLSLQHQIFNDLAIQVGYVGKLGRKLLLGWTINPGIYRPGATLANINERRPYQPFGQLDTISSLANSRYNALQVELNKRFSRGFSVQGAYTFSRSIDMSSSISLGSRVPNVFDLSTEFGLSDFHAKHIASFSWIWELPDFPRTAVLHHVLGGWQVNGLVNLRSGMPFNVLLGRDVALSGTPNQRPNVVGEHRLPSDRPRGQKILAWFDRTAFASPATGTYGNVGRNALIGPAFASTNAGIFKHFRLPWREGMRLQFRGEFFNLFNSVNLSSPNAQLSAGANMGRITSAGSARVIQFALKVLF